eukprot:6212042-Pleurochrysis_carterae.AAC.6
MQTPLAKPELPVPLCRRAWPQAQCAAPLLRAAHAHAPRTLAHLAARGPGAVVEVDRVVGRAGEQPAAARVGCEAGDAVMSAVARARLDHRQRLRLAAALRTRALSASDQRPNSLQVWVAVSVSASCQSACLSDFCLSVCPSVSLPPPPRFLPDSRANDSLSRS